MTEKLTKFGFENPEGKKSFKNILEDFAKKIEDTSKTEKNSLSEEQLKNILDGALKLKDEEGISEEMREYINKKFIITLSGAKINQATLMGGKIIEFSDGGKMDTETFKKILPFTLKEMNELFEQEKINKNN